MNLSTFGRRFTRPSGITRLMQDLGEAMAAPDGMLMLGGGNPAHIPEVQMFLRDRLERIVHDPAAFARIAGNYDPPGGDPAFIEALADLLNGEYGWGIGPENIVLTAGSQAGFFLLFNMLAGEFDDGTQRRILLPMAPEYIGYSDVGLSDGLFRAQRPSIERFSDHTFKYHVDFDRLAIGEDIAAICVSRPTNPTGNVLTDGEIARLHELARANDIPLIIDNAYGLPFPGIVFTEAAMPWSEHIVLCMSLSKLGLPGARTGMIIAPREIAGAIAGMNGIFNLAMGSFGPALVLDLVRSGEILGLSRNVIRPYYQRKAQHAMELFHEALAGLEYCIHRVEGAIFLWLWFPGLGISSEELYQRLKQRGVLILSGHHFFPGLEDDWPHRHECIRVSYAMPDDTVERGIRIIAEEVRRAGRRP
jgi:valine--pyruvate aminotransferase